MALVLFRLFSLKLIPTQQDERESMSLEVFQLNRKNALVTGSHRGLGAAIAVALARPARTWVAMADPNPGAACDEVRAAGRKTFISRGFGGLEVVLGLIEKTISVFGSIDILVNNAGVIRRAPAAEYPAEFWDELIAVNLTAVFTCRSSQRGTCLNETGEAKY